MGKKGVLWSCVFAGAFVEAPGVSEGLLSNKHIAQGLVEAWWRLSITCLLRLEHTMSMEYDVNGQRVLEARGPR